MSKRFERLERRRVEPIFTLLDLARSVDHDIESLACIINAHSEAIEGLEERTEAMSRGHGSACRRWLEDLHALTKRVAALEGWMHRALCAMSDIAGEKVAAQIDKMTREWEARNTPTPEPVVVEGPAREMLELLGREFVCECGGAPFTDGDHVRLTIERVGEAPDDDA